ncbi:gliding motility-associated C-terminal domain-containing protein [Fluviicola taffensis]|uniref:T9SS type B sorting domain-containing protein n=1 Tax=Fluviicola taffensis TaxID=191579 RepID=UPI0031384174
MKHLLLTLLLFLTLNGFSQPPCGSNPAAGNTCATATPICELNGYCGNTSASYTANSWSQSCGFLGLSDCGLNGEFCGSIENNSFLTFVASSSSISFDVWVYNSTYGDGIQIMIFSANNCSGTVNSYYCDALSPSASSQSVSASGLTPGNTYYIMIDGFAGDICDYTFAANTGIAIPVDVSPANSSICVGETVALTASGGNGTFTWVASPNLSGTTGSTVTATPPTTPGTYTYTVNSATGNPLCPSSTTATATIVVNPCGCTVNATNSGPVCSGTSTINLFATTIVGATYSWTGPNGFVSSAQNPTGVPIPSAPGTYNFTVDVNDNGSLCSSTTTVTVNALPAVNAGTNSSICIGGSVTLSGSGAQSYTWNNGATDGVAFNPTVNQTYTVTGTDANGCQNTDQVDLVVNPLPTVSAGAPQAVCQGASVILSGAGAQSYTWNNSVTNGISFTPGSTQTYTVTGTDANGCQNTGQVVVTVNPLPLVEAGLPQAVCQGTSVTLSGSGAQSYTWNNGGIDNVPFTPNATLTYTCTGTDANGCQNTDQVIVTVNPSPTVNAGNDQVVCAGTSVTLSASGASNYVWNNGVTNGIAFTPGSTQTYTVTVSVNGCQSTDQVTVTVNALPIVNAGADQSICIGSELTLSGSGAQNYIWNNGVTDGVSFTPGSTQTYTVTGTDANGCTDTDQITVTIVLIPNASVSADVTNGSPTLTVNFDNNSTNASTYHWSFGDGFQTNASTSASQQYGYTIPGEYVVVLTAANGACVDTDTLLITVIPVPDPIVVIPNIFTPNGDHNNDQFFLEVSYAKSVKVQIVNRWGDKMVDYDDVQGYWDGTVNGNLASDGVYFFNYQVEGLNGTILSGHGNVQLIR